MLQRAASNAYSWWMASHIRTKQSKWMEQNLADMEEKVSAVIKLLSEEGDSFMQKAEMYYKKRPELIHFVEEFFRGYRALADRYDHLSTELQNANNTIAQVCPDQVRGMEDDDDDSSPRYRKKPTAYVGKVPNVPKLPVKELKFITSAKKKVKDSKVAAATAKASKSGLTKDEGVGEIGRIQKLILALQTEKEFVKSSYETGLAKYRDVENKIKAMQEKVDTLQDEFGEGKVIDDEEARVLMATTALKSCKSTLDQLQETRDRAVTESEVERTRIKASRGKLDSLKKMFLPNESIADEPIIHRRLTKSEPKASHIVEKIKDDIESEVGDDESMMDMAEKINVLVNKVTSLETSVASQTALIQRIRLEDDELQAQIQSLEECVSDEKHDLKVKITEMELKLQGIQDLEHSLEGQNKNIQSHFNEAQSNLDKLSQKVKPVVELETPKTFSVLPKNEPKKVAKKVAKKAGSQFLAPKVTSSPPDQVESIKGPNESKEVNEGGSHASSAGETGGSHESSAGETGGSHESSAAETGGSHESSAAETGGRHESYAAETGGRHESSAGEAGGGHESSAGEAGGSHESSAGETEGGHESSEVSKKGEGLKASSVIANTESKDHEYAAELSQNLEETKKKLMELETNHQNDLFEMTLQLKELKNSNTKKDEEIRSLRLKLSRTHCINQKDDNTEESDESKESYENSHLLAQGEDEEDTIPVAVKESETASAVEKQFRANIDELLEENLDFWFRFSSTLYEIQRFKTGVKDLEGEVLKLDERQDQEGSSSSKYSIKSDVRPLYKHLKEMQTDLSAWIEKSASLKEELKNRSASLSEIQEEITKALKASAEDEEFSFTSYQAAKFQGEILNMKQENNRVADELQAGLDLARTLQRDAETSITKLSDDWGLSGSKSRHGTSSGTSSNSSSSMQGGAHSNVPLRSFIFGAKPKKKNSIFSSVVQQRKHKSGY